jgi:AbrB family looped-hinge helix DNA binding protein
MPVSKLGERRQVVIPKTIWDELGLVAGDYVEVERVARTVVLKPKKLVDADVLIPDEEEVGDRHGETATLSQVEKAIEHQARKRGGKTTRKGAA